MRCVVTGGLGFIGSNLAVTLEAAGHEVTIIDNLNTGSKLNAARFRGRIWIHDLREPIHTDGAVDAFFHQAAITDPRHEKDHQVYDNNIRSFKNILDEAMRHDAILVYASTASVYGNTPAPQKEDQSKELLSAYASSKLIIDEIASQHFKDRRVVGLRYFNVFGPGEQWKGRAASMVMQLFGRMRLGQRPRIFHDGHQRRDHVYVKDCVKANLLALQAPSGIYNVGTGVATSFNKLVEYLNRILRTNLEPEYVDNPYVQTYQAHTQAETSLARAQLRFVAEYSLPTGLAEYARWLTEVNDAAGQPDGGAQTA